ncbi:MAG: hypothetical protein ABI822_31015 [Bryobacteraceae bacterium]
MAGEVAARASLVWLVLIAAEVVHGILRTMLLVPLVGDLPARQIGVLVGSLLILLITTLFVRWIGAKSTKELLAVGFGWLLLTASFEIGFGLLVFGRTWSYLKMDYDIPHGGLLPFGFVVLLFAPWIAARIRS